MRTVICYTLRSRLLRRMHRDMTTTQGLTNLFVIAFPETSDRLAIAFSEYGFADCVVEIIIYHL